MKHVLTAALYLLGLGRALAQSGPPLVVTADIDRFWAAYDKITATPDSARQYAYLNTLFIEPGTPGLKALMQARRYTPASYIAAIRAYPKFWQSVRPNTAKAGAFAREIGRGVEQLRAVYPRLRPAPIYFTVGALRSPGTTLDGQVLIGAELAMADHTTVTTELPAGLAHLNAYFATDPIKELVFLNVHEYVHTQQRTTIGTTLVAQCVIEGVAELLAVKATGRESPTPAIGYGKTHADTLRASFTREMFSPNFSGWLWNNTDNAFRTRDLGYYIGYAIGESYLARATDKQQAINEMVELDYGREEALAAFIDRSGYFARPYAVLKAEFESRRPRVTGLREFSNGSQTVDPATKQLTITFSKPMDTRFRNLILGPLGEANVLPVVSVAGFAADGKSITYGIELKPDQRYQLVVNYQFRAADGTPLVPYLIDIKTARP